MKAMGPMLLVFGLVSCGPGLRAYNPDGDTDTGTFNDDPVQILDVDPNWGLPDGGTPVTLRGVGFSGDVQVWFGNASIEVTRLDDETLLVTSPDAGVEATVDVKVSSDLGDAIARDGFEYSFDKPADTDVDTGTDTGDTGEVRPTGRVGGMAQYTRLQIACPECFGATQPITINAQAAFHDGTNTGWFDWMPSTGTCASNPSPQPASSRWVDAGEWIYLQSGSSSVSLRRTTGASGTYYESGDLGDSSWLANASFDLSVPDGASLGGSFTTDDVLTTPQGFTAIEPQTMLYTDPNFAFAAEISERNPTFSWAPSGGSGTFVVIVDVYSYDGASYLGQVYCHGPDNGRMSVPSAAFVPYAYGSLLAITMYRTWQDEGVISVNGHTVQTLAQSGVLGTGVLAP